MEPEAVKWKKVSVRREEARQVAQYQGLPGFEQRHTETIVGWMLVDTDGRPITDENGDVPVVLRDQAVGRITADEADQQLETTHRF